MQLKGVSKWVWILVVIVVLVALYMLLGKPA